MSTIIGMKELRVKTGEITQRVQAGETFIVVSRSKPIFEIHPPSQYIPLSETKAWTKEAIERYRPALEALAKE